MTTATAPARTIDDLRRAAFNTRGGFVAAADMPAIVAANRLEPLLVRWSTGRAIVPAQYVAGLIEIIDNSCDETVYAWDVSFPADADTLSER
jgi:hypothetical protein